MESLINLFKSHFGEQIVRILPLKADGSDRRLFRLIGETHTAVGVENRDRAENRAFLEFSRHFRSVGLPVPEVYEENLPANIYLEEDLGDKTLFDLLTETRADDHTLPDVILSHYERAVRYLPKFQIHAGKSLDYSLCYPRHTFDRQSMMWDLNYFKYYFLKLAKIHFNEQKLEDDFARFTDFLLQAERDYFLYRDFQSRNIMIRNGDMFFIDYQGGRKGALQYDLASLLFDAKANIPREHRSHLLDVYLESANRYAKIERAKFLRHYHGYVLIRMMQAMGAYGFRGYFERKSHFLQSVPYAVRNLEQLLDELDLPVNALTLVNVLEQIVQNDSLRKFQYRPERLTVRITSFSYRHGLPVYNSDVGGGFVFDCRVLPNPGRLEEYVELTGNDAPVIEFLERRPEVTRFLKQAFRLVGQSVANYLERNFTELLVAFGCTGGRHRSVFMAGKLAQYLRSHYDVEVEVKHRELNKEA